VELYKNAAKDSTLVGLLMLFGSTGKIVHSFAVDGDIESGHCIGYDSKGQEFIRVPIKEPIIIREKHDKERDVKRISVT
jgi:hypothetical protein